ncbi:hypothetical protein D3C78_1772600 [compost metagenome]
MHSANQSISDDFHHHLSDAQRKIKAFLEELEAHIELANYVQLADVILYEVSFELQEFISLLKGYETNA